MRHNETYEEPPAPGIGHETRDVSTRLVIIFGVSLVVAAIVIHIGLWLLYMFWSNQQARADVRQFPMAEVGSPPVPPAPRLQTQPQEELKKMRADEAQLMNSYGWVDAGRGTVRIPIDRAMQLLLQQGLPTRPQTEGTGPAGMPQRSSSGRTVTPFQRY